jgi:hypothetical protein
MALSFWFIAFAIAGGIWYWLDAREKKRVAVGLSRFSGLRLALATFGIFTVLFSGGCGAVFLGSWILSGMRSADYVGWQVVGIFTLPPLAIGAFIWWLSMRRSSR